MYANGLKNTQMKNRLFTSRKQFTISDFNLRHSILKLKSTDNTITVNFLGVYYMELSNCFHGIEIYELEKNEVEQLIKYKKNINRESFNFYKIVSNNETYFFAMLSIKISNNVLE